MNDDPLKVLERLGDEFARVARSSAEPRRRTWRRWALLTIPAALTIGGAAYAAAELLDGAPVRNPPGVAYRLHVGVGVPRQVAGAVLTPLRVKDPDGGPPWGIRVLRTTRGYGCVQVGRVAGKRLGILGQDGSMSNDGRFHERAADVVGQNECTPLDGAGHAFIALAYSGRPASGAIDGCSVPAQLRSAGRYRSRMPSACPERSLRNIYYGLLGPLGKSVTYRGDDGRPHTVPATAGDGAYLVVVRPTPQHPGKGTLIPSQTPVSGLLSVQYRDGRSCRLTFDPPTFRATRCPRAGYVPYPARTVSLAAARAPVTLTELAPVASRRGPRGERLEGYRRVAIRFTARLANDSRSSYRYLVDIRHRPEDRCTGANRYRVVCQESTLGGEISRDISRSDPVTKTFTLSLRSDPTVSVTVRYYPTNPDPADTHLAPDPRAGVLVGRATLALRRLSSQERERLRGTAK